jgi:hypothetical protein
MKQELLKGNTEISSKISIAPKSDLLYNKPTGEILGFCLKLMGKGAEHYEFSNQWQKHRYNRGLTFSSGGEDWQAGTVF